MTTSPLRIDLICDCMGMNRFTSHSTMPTATIVMMTVVSGISLSPIVFPEPVDTQVIFEQFERFALNCFCASCRLFPDTIQVRSREENGLLKSREPYAFLFHGAAAGKND